MWEGFLLGVIIQFRKTIGKEKKRHGNAESDGEHRSADDAELGRGYADGSLYF
jgi:hypothetical protein